MSTIDKTLEADYYATKTPLTIFRPDNYEYWAWCTRLVLQGKNLLDIIDSTALDAAATSEGTDTGTDTDIAKKIEENSRKGCTSIDADHQNYSRKSIAADL
jgi:hypothetical protein